MTIQVQASIPYFTNIPRDVVTNTFYFDYTGGGDPITSDYEALGALVAAFYEQVFDDTTNALMAPWMNLSGFRVRMYDFDDIPPRVPVFEAVDTLNIVPGATGDVPPEVAAVLSFHGALESGTSAARRRGRVYIGGLGTQCVQVGDDDSFPELHNLLMLQMREAAGDMMTNAAIIDWQWVVWSTVNQSSTPVVGGWVDKAFDTQRRRGVDPSRRDLWPVEE